MGHQGHQQWNAVPQAGPPVIRSTAAPRRWLLPAIVVVGFALLAAACGSDDADQSVRPFEEVQGSDLVFENDPTFPGRGIFRVATTEPMICAIVWGDTDQLGNINNSLEMNGTGIVQHNVFLPGAEAGQTYFYRVQGSAADGTLYQSELATFTLPEADNAGDTSADGDDATNLALQASVVEVSSEFGEGWSGANAIDGDLATEWATAGEGDSASIVIDLGRPMEVGAVEFLTRTMADGSATATTFMVTVDGTPFGPFPAGNPADAMPAEVAAQGQILQFDVESSTGGNTGAIEIRVFAAS